MSSHTVYGMLEGHCITVTVKCSETKTIPNLIFENLGGRFLFGNEAKAASEIWPYNSLHKLSTSFLSSQSEEKVREIIHGFLSDIMEGVSSTPDIRLQLALPQTMIAGYGHAFETSAKERNLSLQLFSVVELLSSYDNGSGTDDFIKHGNTVYLYDGYESTEIVIVRHDDNTSQRLVAIYTGKMEKVQWIGAILSRICEAVSKKFGQVESIVVASSREWCDALSGLKVPIRQLEISSIQAQLQGPLDAHQNNAEFTFYDAYSRDYYLALTAGQERIAPYVSQFLDRMDDYTFGERESLAQSLERSLSEPESAEAMRLLACSFLQSNGPMLKVGVISPFSYGKSTLINAMLGARLLKEDIRAETANVTHMVHGTSYAAVIEQEDSIDAKVFEDLESLRVYLNSHTSVRGQGENNRRIYISIPMHPLYKNIEWVDTPGLFSRYRHHDDVTDRIVPELDLLLFLIDPKKVGDANYTARIDQYSKGKEEQCIFVIGKMDLYPKDGAKLVSDLKESLPSRLSQAPVFTVSGYMALMARLALSGDVPFLELQQDLSIYAEEEGMLISGELLSVKHLPVIVNNSGMIELERFLRSKMKSLLKRGTPHEFENLL